MNLINGIKPNHANNAPENIKIATPVPTINPTPNNDATALNPKAVPNFVIAQTGPSDQSPNPPDRNLKAPPIPKPFNTVLNPSPPLLAFTKIS